MINNPAEVSHKESLPVSPLSLEQPGVIMTCQHIWCERLTASPPNRASSGHHSPGRPPIPSLPLPSLPSVAWTTLGKCEVCFNRVCVHYCMCYTSTRFFFILASTFYHSVDIFFQNFEDIVICQVLCCRISPIRCTFRSKESCPRVLES